jgi:hypothetical protein
MLLRAPAALLLVACGGPTTTALDNGLALTPPQGWRSWNCFHGEVNDQKIRATIDAITDKRHVVDGKPTSLADLGYDSVGIDDGWQACGTGYKGSFHAADGTPLINKTKFPDLKALVSYGHGYVSLVRDYEDIESRVPSCMFYTLVQS